MRDRFYMAAYAALLILAAAGLQHMWQRHMDLILLETEDGIDETVTQVNSLIDETQSHVAMLRISAESALRDIERDEQHGHSYGRLVKPNAANGGYCSSARETEHPSISGLGPVPLVESPAGHEIEMALMLAPQFAATERNIPNMAWAYYTSAQRFLALYPFTACGAFAFSDDLYQHEFFTLGEPARNPRGNIFWTAAYVDEAGKGLMATVGAPVRDAAGNFRGTIAIDLTLATLSQYLAPRQAAGGELTIVNEQEQVLGHTSLLAKGLAAAPQLKDVVPDYDAAMRDLIFGAAGDGFASHGAHLVVSHPLSGAPWRVVYVADRAALTLRAWRQSGVEIAGLLLLAGLIVAFETARRRSRQLKANLADLALANERAEKARREADNANRAKSLMMANVSHDLRTPLNAIIGFSDVMARQLFGALGSERYTDYARDIKASGELLLKIINNLLDLSKAESGQYKLQEEVAEVPALIENCRHLVEQQAKAAGIELDTHVARGLPAVRMDQRAIQRVILNLVSNAIKFTRPGGRVTLSARTDPQDQLTVTVADNGAGIAPADLAQLFKPFARGASAHKANCEGTGLGLSIVKSLVELHGGTVHMTSTVGFGTTVTFRLPATRNWRPDQPLPELPPMELPKTRPANSDKPRAAA